MKIAIVTVYDSFINYGSFLQAFGMKSIFEEYGHEVFFIRRMSDEKVLNRLNNIAWDNFAVKKNKNLRLLREINHVYKYIRECYLNKKRFNISKRNDWDKINIIDYNECEKYGIDCIICGSDEIWNVHNKDVDMNFYTCGWNKSIPMYAVAISSGVTKESELSNNDRENIKAFKEIYPRDEMTFELCNALDCSTNPVICDPTIMAGKAYFDKFETSYKPKQKYMLVYSYVFSKKQKEILKKYASENGLKLISACIYADFVDEVVYTSALEFPALVKNAECMYTATFHGTIFGLMFAKRLCCIPRLSKIQSLLNRCGANVYTASEESDYRSVKAVLDKKLDHNLIDKSLENIKEETIDIIKELLEGKMV